MYFEKLIFSSSTELTSPLKGNQTIRTLLLMSKPANSDPAGPVIHPAGPPASPLHSPLILLVAERG